MRECGDNNGTEFIRCVSDSLDAGHPDCTLARMHAGNCSDEAYKHRCADFMSFKREGYAYTTNKTGGCVFSCRQFYYDTKVLLRDEMWKFSRVDDKHTAMVVVRLLRSNSYPMIREEKSYGLSEFTGDFGGTAGLLLGLSIWGHFNTVVDHMAYAIGLFKKWGKH